MLDYFGTKIEIPVKVVKEVVTDIKVDYNPIKTDYLLDESIDLTGLEGNVVYNSGVTKKLQDLIAAGDADTTVSYDFSKAGKTQVTITHTHGDVTKEYKFDVNVAMIWLIYPLYLCGDYFIKVHGKYLICLLYTSDAADD